MTGLKCVIPFIVLLSECFMTIVKNIKKSLWWSDFMVVLDGPKVRQTHQMSKVGHLSNLP